MSNLKIDIIYYKTASDFEMEFNLSGCCRMRMFKDKVDTPKGLVNTLARDVSRSKIIIIVTEIFGDNTGVEVISKAIKLPLVHLNKEDFGIRTTDDVYIPKTSVPLVTKSGVFGGCIIENGPQSIIILSSARALRHEIMKSYVHNYVFDIAQMHAYQERMGSAPMPTAVIGKHTQVPTEATPSAVLENTDAEISEDSSPAETTVDAPVIEEPVIEEPITQEPVVQEPITENVVTEVTEKPVVEELHSKSTNNFTVVYDEPIYDTDDNQSETEAPKKKRRKKGRASNIILLIIVLLLLCGFGILAYYFVYLPLLGQPSSFSDGSSNIVTEFLENLFS